MLDRFRTGSEEHQVAWIERRSGREVGAGVVLVLGYSRQADAGLGVDPLDQAGAVESDPRPLAAPDVRRAQIGLGVGNDHRTESDPLARSRRAGQFKAVAASLLVRAGIGEHHGHVGIGVVVGEDRGVQESWRSATVRAEQSGGRVDGIPASYGEAGSAPPGATVA